MRKLLSALLITVLALPAPVFAQTAYAPNDPNNPAFAKLLGDTSTSGTVKYNDLHGYTYNTYKDVTNNGVTTQTVVPVTVASTTDFQDAINNPLVKNNPSCNPVVWASLVQQARQQMLRDMATAAGINGQLTGPMNNKCTTNMGTGTNGQPISRPTIIQNVQNYLQQNGMSLLCSLNWSSLFGFSFKLSLNLCSGNPPQLFSVGASNSLQSSFNVNGQDPTKSADCPTSGSVNSNLMRNASGPFGTSILGGGIGTFDNSGAGPAGSGTSLLSFGFGASTGTGGSGGATSGGLNSSSSSSTSATTGSGSNTSTSSSNSNSNSSTSRGLSWWPQLSGGTSSSSPPASSGSTGSSGGSNNSGNNNLYR